MLEEQINVKTIFTLTVDENLTRIKPNFVTLCRFFYLFQSLLCKSVTTLLP